MWIVLGCLTWCDDIEERQRSHWDAQAALHSDSNWSTDLFANEVAELEHRRFETQRQCLHALRRALPERDEGSHGGPDEPWGYIHVEHFPDYLVRSEGGGLMQGAGMNEHYYFACFQEAPLVG
jgi:hypothetical protein